MNIIKKLDLTTVTDAQIDAFTVLANTLRTERQPDDPPIEPEEIAAHIKHNPPFIDLHFWIAQDGPHIIARGNLVLIKMETNQHLGQVDIAVLPAHRRRGLGRALLERVTRTASEAGRRLLITSSSSRVPSGAEFLTRYGFQSALENRVSQLVLSELEPGLLRDWIGRAQERATDFELGFWDGPYPEDQLPAIAKLMTVMNTAPKGELDVDDMEFTPEQVLQLEKEAFATGGRRITAYVRERATGRFAGFTEINYHPNRPTILNQGGTGVFPEFRNLGLGRWLKAATLERVLSELPEAQFVRTGNAESNAAMLGINVALGFKPYYTITNWQAEVSTVLRNLT
jgi:GNAT superfamily N-acetyltransferase